MPAKKVAMIQPTISLSASTSSGGGGSSSGGGAAAREDHASTAAETVSTRAQSQCFRAL